MSEEPSQRATLNRRGLLTAGLVAGAAIAAGRLSVPASARADDVPSLAGKLMHALCRKRDSSRVSSPGHEDHVQAPVTPWAGYAVV